MNPFLAVLLPALISGMTGSAATGVVMGQDPMAMTGGGLIAGLFGFGIAYMQSKQKAKKKK